jgi:hypothetical protein
MNTYLRDRLRCDCAHVLARAKSEESISHQGLKGRFRELLIDALLAPWLPPFVACGTGLVVDGSNSSYMSGQEDIILYDRALSPPILASSTAPEGVFLSNSALARIEVKSRIDANAAKDFVRSSLDVAKLRVVTHRSEVRFTGTLNMLFAFSSDVPASPDKLDFELLRLVGALNSAGTDPLSRIVSTVCVANRGFWKINLQDGKRMWARLRTDDPLDYIVWFVACVSSSCFALHAARSGRSVEAGLEGRVGHYLDSPYDPVSIPP